METFSDRFLGQFLKELLKGTPKKLTEKLSMDFIDQVTQQLLAKFLNKLLKEYPWSFQKTFRSNFQVKNPEVFLEEFRKKPSGKFLGVAPWKTSNSHPIFLEELPKVFLETFAEKLPKNFPEIRTQELLEEFQTAPPSIMLRTSEGFSGETHEGISCGTAGRIRRKFLKEQVDKHQEILQKEHLKEF